MELVRHWRLKKQRYAMIGNVCPHCETKFFPPRDNCTECGKSTRVDIEPPINVTDQLLLRVRRMEGVSKTGI